MSKDAQKRYLPDTTHETHTWTDTIASNVHVLSIVRRHRVL